MTKMKTMALAAALVTLLASAAYSICEILPTDGTYSTYAGTLLSGRVSEAWCTLQRPGVPGNTENAESWNGAALGTQWHAWGMAIDEVGPVETARFLDAGGTGWIDYNTNYDGGLFWLAGSGPWGGPAEGFTGFITYYNVSTRVTYVNNAIVGATSNVFFTGGFDICPTCSIEYAIANAMLVWQTGMLNQPANYPAFLCDATAGEYFDACCIQAKIYCIPIGTEPSSWGAIKSMYR